MKKVRIVTDTVCCLPDSIVKEYGIRIVPMSLAINGKPYRDQVDIGPDEFWKMFDNIKEFKTGAPALTEFTSIFSDLSKETDDIACVFVSKALSATYEAACQARELFLKDNPRKNIEIIDSRTAAGAQGFIALEMARAAATGKSLKEVTQVAHNMIPRVKFACALETLKYLIKSGRAPKTAYLGELMHVRPIIGMVNNTGLVENLGRARGKEKSMERLVELVSEYVKPDQPLHVMVHYTNSIDDGKQLQEMVLSKFNCVEHYMTPYTPVMSGHTGPVFAISFYA